MTNRIMINAPTGVIEVEGEKEFVEAQLDKLMPLIQACGFGATPETDTASSSSNISDQNSTVDDEGAATTSPEKSLAAKRSRRGSNKPPKGHSCADRMLELRKDGFFKTPKTPAEIVEGLGKKGWTHASNQVSAAGGQMFNRGDIQRTKEGKGFAYFWDRE